jgi:hypothetical protein
MAASRHQRSGAWGLKVGSWELGVGSCRTPDLNPAATTKTWDRKPKTVDRGLRTDLLRLRKPLGDLRDLIWRHDRRLIRIANLIVDLSAMDAVPAEEEWCRITDLPLNGAKSGSL